MTGSQFPGQFPIKLSQSNSEELAFTKHYTILSRPIHLSMADWLRNSMADQHRIGNGVNLIGTSSNPIILKVNSYHAPPLTPEHLPFTVESRRISEYIRSVVTESQTTIY
ncbi:MAG: hypothetical protein QGI86_14305 [Candidatus Poribacteria bacterium]|nr:hypothetical protein [Candidatus Poribacteria bacterium]